MAERTRPIEVESRNVDGVREVLEPPQKKPRLDTGIEGSVEEKQQKQPTKQSSKKRKEKNKHTLPEPYSTEDVLARDVAALLGEDAVNNAVQEETEWAAPFEPKEELELVVSDLSPNGDSLSITSAPKKPWVVVAPFGLPGETIRVRVYRHSRLYSYADLLEVVKPNPEWRDDTRVQCKYFGKCAGCQYQMLSYDTQLELKRKVVVKAYQNFSGLPPSTVPPIQPTIPSPAQYGYRTKITPHFDAPPKRLQREPPPPPAGTADRPEWLKIGFNQIGTRHVMDIEECPIATPTLNAALGPMREEISRNIYKYKKGVSLLLRDSLEIPPEGAADALTPVEAGADEKHICVTDHKATVRERVGPMLFEYVAGSFFQNNNAVLTPLTAYVRDAILPAAPPSLASPAAFERPTHLVDAYCGAGLFAIALAPHFAQVAGIELSADSIRCATRNAALNDVPDRCAFQAGDAAAIFATVQDFPRSATALVIDPPRKGTDARFIEQMLDFGAGTVVYVSCNVHTQARDVGMILKSAEGRGGARYVLESVRGFDLFPQTAHVESVAVLRRIEKPAAPVA